MLDSIDILVEAVQPVLESGMADMCSPCKTSHLEQIAFSARSAGPALCHEKELPCGLALDSTPD